MKYFISMLETNALFIFPPAKVHRNQSIQWAGHQHFCLLLFLGALHRLLAATLLDKLGLFYAILQATIFIYQQATMFWWRWMYILTAGTPLNISDIFYYAWGVKLSVIPLVGCFSFTFFLFVIKSFPDMMPENP